MIIYILIPFILLLAFAVFAGVNPSAPVGTSENPAFTWNLIVAPLITALTSALVVFFIGRQFKTRDEKDIQIANLLAENMKEKERSLDEWRRRYTDTQCAIKNKLDEIGEDMHKKVTWDHCDKRENEVKKDIQNLEERLKRDWQGRVGA